MIEQRFLVQPQVFDLIRHQLSQRSCKGTVSLQDILLLHHQTDEIVLRQNFLGERSLTTQISMSLIFEATDAGRLVATKELWEFVEAGPL